MHDEVVALGHGFWNVRGSHESTGFLDLGTQCSLVQLDSGKFIFLDSYTLAGDVRDEIMALTNEGEDVEAILNLHPFHTVHCAQMATDFSNAIMYGSSRHHMQVPEVDWEPEVVESDVVIDRYPELQFSLPEGIYYIAPQDDVHSGSLLAYHPASKSLHVDDTFVTPPFAHLRDDMPVISIHPRTKDALKDEPNAVEHYYNWAIDIAKKWGDTENFCAAHSALVKFENRDFETTLIEAINNGRAQLGQ